MLLRLPDEILHRVLWFVTDGQVDLNGPANTCNRFSRALPPPEVVALLQCCARLRVKLAPLIFDYVSLVRTNEVDTIMANSRDAQVFSDDKVLDLKFMRDVVEHNHGRCGSRSRYSSSLAANLFVRVLEITNTVFVERKLRWFPNLTSLKVLDVHHQSPIAGHVFRKLPHLTSLSIPLGTLAVVVGLPRLLQQLENLELLCDFAQITPDMVHLVADAMAGASLGRLVILTNEPNCLMYTEFVTLLAQLGTTQLHMRLVRATFTHVNHWEIHPDPYNAVASTLAKLPLRHLSFDVKLFSSMKKVGSPSPGTSLFSLTLVDRTPNSLMGNTQDIIGLLISLLGVKHINYMYGRVLEQQGFYNYHNLTMFVGHLASTYKGIVSCSTEEYWSPIEVADVRDHLEKHIDWYLRADASQRKAAKRALDAACVVHTSNNTDVFSAEYNELVVFVPSKNKHHNHEFWQVEALLKEMEQYCLKAKPRSRLWG